MSEFVKVGERILAKPSGCDYDLLPNKTYSLMFEDWTRTSYLTEAGDLNLPEKIYSDKKDEFFIKRVLDDFEATDSTTTGILLAGMKGSGKTLTAKLLAKRSNLPIIIVDSRYEERFLSDFFSKIQTPVCILFDEIDKDFHTSRLLSFLDGIQDTVKKMVIFTCNQWDEDHIDTNMIDRCSRIKYFKEYTGMSEELIDSILANNLEGDPRINDVKDIIVNKFAVTSFDNISSFVKEVKKYPNETIDTIISDLNITFVEQKEEEEEVCIKAKKPIPVTMCSDCECACSGC